MGVQGLWKLVEPCGRMVPLEAMSNKVLAVDVSIWLHQAMKGMHDIQGAPVAVAHLLVLFHRLCKLLFYKIKPVFVFDGGVPVLKRQTMATRRMKKTTARSEASRVRGKLLKNLLKHEAIRHVLSDESATAALGLSSLTLPGPSEEEDLYKLPPVATQASASNTSASESEAEEDEEGHLDIHSVDVNSPAFKALPAEVRHDILSDMKETRKQSSWRHLDQMPQQSQDFSDFQMNRLLKRRAVQVSLEECGKEMGARDVSMQELQGLLGEGFSRGSVLAGKVAQTDSTHYMLIQKPQNLVQKPKQEGLVAASEGFDISEHLEDILWSSDSEGESTLMDVSEESDKIDGDLKPNQYPLSQLLSSASKKIMDDIATVLEEGLEEKSKKELEVERETKNREELKDEPENVFEVSERDGIEAKRIEKLQVEPKEVLEVSEKNQMDVDEDNAKSLKGEKLSMDEVGEKVILVDEVRLNVESERFVKIKRETRDKEITDILNVLEDCTEDSLRTASSGYSSQALEDSGTLKEAAVRICSDNKEKSENSTLEDLNCDKVKAEVENSQFSSEIDERELEKEILSDHIESVPPVEGLGKSIKLNKPHEIQITPESPEKSTNVAENQSVQTICEARNEEIEQKDNLKSENVAGTEGSSKSEEGSESDEDFVVVEDSPPIYPAKKSEVMDVQESEEIQDKLPSGMSEVDMKEMGRNLAQEMDCLMSEKGRQERLAQTVTDQMCADAQELLRLFGVPYIVAPMEAEAQCAALDLLGLTQGTITDDSDIWLFGGTVVYKNFFNQKKHVLEYRSDDIRQYFKLSREEMVRLALLVGSDYTPGLPGIGPVTALEVLAAFPSPKEATTSEQLLVGLKKFQEWVSSGFVVGPTRATLKNKVKNTSLLPGFPSRAVVEAYLRPEVDDSKEPFSWAKPNLQLLEKYAKLKFGWSTERCNELLLPVMKKLLETTDQPTIDRFFRVLPAPTLLEGRLSKRVEGAVKRLGRPMESDDSDEDEPGTSKPKRAKQTGAAKKRGEKAAVSLDALTERLHKETVIPQRERDRMMREELKKKAAELLKGGRVRGRGRSRGSLVVKAAPCQARVDLSESSDSS